jgi:hypothetical protein
MPPQKCGCALRVGDRYLHYCGQVGIRGDQAQRDQISIRNPHALPFNVLGGLTPLNILAIHQNSDV